MKQQTMELSLQENVLTLLCYDDVAGQQIANLVDASLFDGDYRDIAEQAIMFWRRHKAAPKEHTPDLVGRLLEDKEKPGRAATLMRILSMMHEVHAALNVPYVMSQLTTFIRMQKFRAAVMESADKLKNNEMMAISEIEQLWSSLLKTSEIGFDAGVRLNDIDRMLAHLEKQAAEFIFGVKGLDDRSVVPRRGTLAVLHGAPGDGKTWFLVNTGKHNLMRGRKVLHLSMEFDAEDVLQRYMMALFSCSERDSEVELTKFLRHSNGRLRDFGGYMVRPEFSFDSNTIRMELETRVNDIVGVSIAENLIIKRWPPNKVTPRDAEAFLDALETNERFVPDIILFDYPRLYKIDPRNPWISIGTNFVDTRATLVERNIAGVSVHQFTKEGARAEKRDMTHGGEAWSVNQTCDTVMSLSKTRDEAEFGLARIFVDKARKARDKYEILITQNYDIGQFCLDSMAFDTNYKKIFARMAGDEEEEYDDD